MSTQNWTKLNEYTSIKQVMTGWGSVIEGKLGEQENGAQTWVNERGMSEIDKQYMKRYLDFLKKDIQKQEIEDLI